MRGRIFLDNQNLFIQPNTGRSKYQKGFKNLTSAKWGQLKLLLSEIEFFTNHWDGLTGAQEVPNPLCVYAGAAPGTHIPILLELFPTFRFHLYDTNPFDPLLRTIENITIYDEYFTEKKAHEYAGKSDVFFISDIRRTDYKSYAKKEYAKFKIEWFDGIKDLTSNHKKARLATEQQIEDEIWEDMQIQEKWTQIIDPVHSLLKFRLPYVLKAEDKNRLVPYLDGIVYWQVFNGTDSSETRLKPVRNSANKYTSKNWNIEIYEEQVFYHNTVERIQNIYDGILINGKTIKTTCGDELLNDFDSTATGLILAQYLLIRKSGDVNQTTICDLFAKILDGLNTDPNTERKTLSIIRKRAVDDSNNGESSTVPVVSTPLAAAAAVAAASGLIIDEYLPTIYEKIVESPITAIISPTGTGKSLGIPKIALQNKNRIFISVPTRTAAYSLYNQQRAISADTASGGNAVGYAADNIIKYNDDTMIVYCTSGHLRRKMFAILSLLINTEGVKSAKGVKNAKNVADDKSFVNTEGVKTADAVAKANFCDILMLDEIHTGNIDNTILISIWAALKKYRPLGVKLPRLVVASASLSAVDLLPFDNFTKIEIEDTSYPVSIQYESPSFVSKKFKIEEAVLNKVLFIHKNYSITDGHILVFVASKREILDLHEKIATATTGSGDVIILDAYGSMDSSGVSGISDSSEVGGAHAISSVYQEYPSKRKIILATNIAETSITIKDVGFIVDSMYENLAGTSSSGGLSLTKNLISKDSAKQRTGRTGRTKPGICFRLCSKNTFEHLADSKVPEIKRVPFYEIILEMIDAGIKEPSQFILYRDENSAPQYLNIENKLQDLLEYDLVNKNDGNFTVTEKGKFAAPLTFGIKNSLFLWHWRAEFTTEKLFPGLVLASLIECYYPPYFYAEIKQGKNEPDKEYALRNEKTINNQNTLTTGPGGSGSDGFYAAIKMFILISKHLSAGSTTAHSSKLLYKESEIKKVCKNYGLNFIKIQEVIKTINHHIKILKIKNIGSFEKSLDKVYLSSIPLLQLAYKNNILTKKQKNDYWDAQHNLYKVRPGTSNADNTADKIISLSSIETEKIRNVNLYVNIPGKDVEPGVSTGSMPSIVKKIVLPKKIYSKK